MRYVSCFNNRNLSRTRSQASVSLELVNATEWELQTSWLQIQVCCLSRSLLPLFLESRRSDIEDAFRSFTSRKDIGIVLINQHICDDIRHVVREYSESGQTIPTILEIPSVDHPYDPTKDSLMQRVQVFFGGNISA